MFALLSTLRFSGWVALPTEGFTRPSPAVVAIIRSA